MIPAEIHSVDWFSRIGAPLAYPPPRLASWEDWPGPEDPRVSALHLRQQALHDQIVADDLETESFFAAVRDEVIGTASKRVRFDPEADAWDPQSLAVWHAGWTAVVVACYRRRNLTLPRELEEQ